MPKIEITDVTLRDGLQAESQSISLEQKSDLFKKLLACDFNRLEVTSFVNPKWIPQLSDAESFCEKHFKDDKYFNQVMAFVPNLKGLEKLLKYEIGWVSCFIATSETFNKKNINQSISETLLSLKEIIKVAKANKRKIRVYISTVWGCPYEGEINDKKRKELFGEVISLHPDEVTLSDTIGVAVPKNVASVVKDFGTRFGLTKTALHMHDTYGMALSNIVAAAGEGVRKFDSSMGGIGGCPYAKGASGNVATELVAYYFNRQGLHAFPKKEIAATLHALRKTGLNLKSKIADIEEKGGTWYGIE